MLIIEPHAGVAPVQQFIAQARGVLDINTYLATDDRLLASIASAVRRGVKVRILVDSKPYGGRPAGEVARLRATGAQVRFAPPRFTGRYRYDHAKYMVDGSWIEIGSANLTESAFTRNREYLWMGADAPVARALRAVFQADWTHGRAGASPRQWLVLSPYATNTLVAVLQQPGPVCVESEELGKDRPILEALRAKGAQVDMVLPVSLSAYDKRVAHGLSRSGVKIRYLRSPYMHAKLIVGQKEAFIGSQNFSWTSLNRNREVGLLLGPADARRLRIQCQRDWRHAHP